MLKVLLCVLFFLTSTACNNDQNPSANDAVLDTADDASVADEDSLLPDEAETPDDDFPIIEGDLECGASDMFWIYDLSTMPPKNVQICAHVRGESEHVRVLVADDAWGVKVDATKIRTLLKAWEIATPTDPKRGIFEIVTDLFGPVPNEFDGYPGLYLFLYEMAGYNGNSFDGYFRIDDQYDGDYSNLREMIHINVAEGKDPTSNYMLSVQAHEFQHLVHWGRDENEEAWLNEAMSELAMVVTGFGADETWVKNWLATPSEPLMSNGPSYDYGVLLLFGAYLHDRFGADFITDLVAEKANGKTSLEAALAKLSEPLTFNELGADFALAVLVQDTTYEDGRFGFTSIHPPRKAASKKVETSATTTVNANGGMAFFTLDNYDSTHHPTITVSGASTLHGKIAYFNLDGIFLGVNSFTIDGKTSSFALTTDLPGVTSAQIALFNPGTISVSVTVTLP